VSHKIVFTFSLTINAVALRNRTRLANAEKYKSLEKHINCIGNSNFARHLNCANFISAAPVVTKCWEYAETFPFAINSFSHNSNHNTHSLYFQRGVCKKGLGVCAADGRDILLLLEKLNAGAGGGFIAVVNNDGGFGNI
jgi:hypothetical protein